MGVPKNWAKMGVAEREAWIRGKTWAEMSSSERAAFRAALDKRKKAPFKPAAYVFPRRVYHPACVKKAGLSLASAEQALKFWPVPRRCAWCDGGPMGPEKR